MEQSAQSTGQPQAYDFTIIRPQVRDEQVRLRRESITPERPRAIKAGLRTLHTLETMAANIYRFQITGEPSEMNRQLIAAMLNEMTHVQDFQVKLFEYGWSPSPLRAAYWLVGLVLGFGSRLLGQERVLKTGIWAERKAVDHYARLLRTIDWDDETRRVIEKDQADEHGHIGRWQRLLAERHGTATSR